MRGRKLFIEIDGITASISEHAERLGMDHHVLYQRWRSRKDLTAPKRSMAEAGRMAKGIAKPANRRGPMDTNNRLRQIKEERGLTQKEIAAITGVGHSTVGHWLTRDDSRHCRRMPDEKLEILINKPAASNSPEARPKPAMQDK